LPSNERNVLYALSRTIGMDTGGRGLIHVRPIRSDQPQVTYNLTDINDIRRVLSAAPLQSGDMIVVEPAGQNAVFVTGLVNMPGPVAVSRNDRISLVRTVAAAGGLRDFLDPPEATLWRRMPDGEQVRVKIELASIMSGKTGDVQLMPGDVLDVPHTPETRFREWAAANIRFGPFGVTAMYDPVADYRARILRYDTGDSGLIRQAFIQSLRTGVSELLVPPVSVSP